MSLPHLSMKTAGKFFMWRVSGVADIPRAGRGAGSGAALVRHIWSDGSVGPTAAAARARGGFLGALHPHRLCCHRLRSGLSPSLCGAKAGVNEFDCLIWVILALCYNVSLTVSDPFAREQSRREEQTARKRKTNILGKGPVRKEKDCLHLSGSCKGQSGQLQYHFSASFQ